MQEEFLQVEENFQKDGEKKNKGTSHTLLRWMSSSEYGQELC